jgi:hypothetical protein
MKTRYIYIVISISFFISAHRLTAIEFSKAPPADAVEWLYMFKYGNFQDYSSIYKIDDNYFIPVMKLLDFLRIA